MNCVYIEITNVCNLHCSFCPCGKKEFEFTRTFMDSELFEKCIKNVQSINVNNVMFHVLGEPTLHPNFSLYIKKLEHTPLKLTLTTNGTTITQNANTLLKSKAIRQINFSTHAYAELNLNIAKKHLQNVLEFCKESIKKRDDLYINLRLWNIGANDSNSWNDFFLEQVNSTFNTNIKLEHFCTRHKSFNIKNKLYIHEDTRFEWPEKTNQNALNTKGTCHALNSHIAILHDGRVVACCLDYNGEILLGNIKTQTLEEILNSPFTKNIHEGFLNHELRHSFCRTCTYCKRFK